jgi:IclR family pca regulon transcriptional regulator
MNKLSRISLDRFVRIVHNRAISELDYWRRVSFVKSRKRGSLQPVGAASRSATIAAQQPFVSTPSMPEADSQTSQTFIRSLARGLAAIEAMGGDTKGTTLSELAAKCALDRATARRILLTLAELGYVRSEGSRFHLTPRVLGLGYAYLSSFPFWDVAKPVMAKLVDQLQESCSAATLDGPYAVYVARIRSSDRIVDVSRTVGSRIPAYCTSLGRVLLAAQTPAEQKKLLARSAIVANTSFTVTQPVKLLKVLAQVRAQGWAIVDQEFELGLRSLAVPVTGAGDDVVAALNISVQAGRITADALSKRYLPALQGAARELSTALMARGNR